MRPEHTRSWAVALGRRDSCRASTLSAPCMRTRTSATVGCFTMLIVGVSYKLIPMFTLSEVQNRHRAAWSIALLSVGPHRIVFHHSVAQPVETGFRDRRGCGLGNLRLGNPRDSTRAANAERWIGASQYFLTAVALLLPTSTVGHGSVMASLAAESVYGPT